MTAHNKVATMEYVEEMENIRKVRSINGNNTALAGFLDSDDKEFEEQEIISCEPSVEGVI